MQLTSLNLFETKEFTHIEPKQKKRRMKKKDENERVHFLKRRMKRKDDVKNHPFFLSTRSFFSAIHLNGSCISALRVVNKHVRTLVKFFYFDRTIIVKFTDQI